MDDFQALLLDALGQRMKGLYAIHPVEAVLQHYAAIHQDCSEDSHAKITFREAESVYRRGSQNLPQSKRPKLPKSLTQRLDLGILDKAGQKSLKAYALHHALCSAEDAFLAAWRKQGGISGAEHRVFYDEGSGRWIKQRYQALNKELLGEYFVRMRLHSLLFPATEYRLEGFTFNSKNGNLCPIVSQQHIAADEYLPPVSVEETDAIMEQLGFAPVRLLHQGEISDEHYAYIHPRTGILVHDLHDENVLRVSNSGELAVIDPCISLARPGAWAQLKLKEIDGPEWPDDVWNP